MDRLPRNNENIQNNWTKWNKLRNKIVGSVALSAGLLYGYYNSPDLSNDWQLSDKYKATKITLLNDSSENKLPSDKVVDLAKSILDQDKKQHELWNKIAVSLQEKEDLSFHNLDLKKDNPLRKKVEKWIQYSKTLNPQEQSKFIELIESEILNRFLKEKDINKKTDLVMTKLLFDNELGDQLTGFGDEFKKFPSKTYQTTIDVNKETLEVSSDINDLGIPYIQVPEDAKLYTIVGNKLVAKEIFEQNGAEIIKLMDIKKDNPIIHNNILQHLVAKKAFDIYTELKDELKEQSELFETPENQKAILKAIAETLIKSSTNKGKPTAIILPGEIRYVLTDKLLSWSEFPLIKFNIKTLLSTFQKFGLIDNKKLNALNKELDSKKNKSVFKKVIFNLGSISNQAYIMEGELVLMKNPHNYSVYSKSNNKENGINGILDTLSADINDEKLETREDFRDLNNKVSYGDASNIYIGFLEPGNVYIEDNSIYLDLEKHGKKIDITSNLLKDIFDNL